MSETMTNFEMDDVLSSIRRLVSGASDDVPAPEPAKVDRFVLTPALRVRDTPVADVAEELDGVTDTTPPAELTQVLTSVVKAAKDAAPPEEAEPVESSPEFAAMETAWKAELAKVAAIREGEVAGVNQDQAETQDRQSLENQIAELEEAVAHTTDDWEPDGSEPEASQPMRRHIFEVVSNSDHNDQSDVDDFEYVDDGELPVFSHTSVPRPKPYLLSDVVSDDSVAENDTETPIDETRVDTPNSSTAIVDDDDVFLDVQALRTMITEVVREELHGKLGETITRNVRKMIQQEISHAITNLPPEEDF